MTGVGGRQPVLVCTPSIGLGGGVEAVVAELEVALGRSREVRVIALLDGSSGRVSPDPVTKARFLVRLGAQLFATRSGRAPVLCAHPALLAACWFGTRVLGRRPVVCVSHGSDAWYPSRVRRWLFGRADIHLWSVSDYTAGRIGEAAHLHVLRPSLARARFESLLAIQPATGPGPPTVLSVFRLNEAVGKGFDLVLDAAARIRDEGIDLQVVAAGRWQLPRDLDDRVAGLPWARVEQDPDDARLAELFAEADLFVLATRVATTRVSRPGSDPRAAPVAEPSGEGYGLVLAEAALAGMAVVGPAGGGSGAAMVDGYTGVRVHAETAEAVAAGLRRLLEDPVGRKEMGRRGREWSAVVHHPDRFAADVERLLAPLWPPGPADADR